MKHHQMRKFHVKGLNERKRREKESKKRKKRKEEKEEEGRQPNKHDVVKDEIT